MKAIQRVFPYYGSKTRLAKLYPTPEFGHIIEPFAGAAAYSQLHWENDVTLYDLSSLICDAWEFLITAKSKDVLSLPNVFPGLDIATMTSLSSGERALLQLHAYDGLAGIEGRRVGKRAIWNKRKPIVASMVSHFNHWKIVRGSWTECPNTTATWFIDPPYVKGGEHYKFSSANIDYDQLALWCLERVGHLIVCENSAANWLPFRVLAPHRGIQKTTIECVYP